MAQRRGIGRQGRVSAPALFAGALGLLALPGAAFAFGALDGEDVSLAAQGSFASFTPASVDPELAELAAERGSAKARLMRFTPAGAADRPDRSVTVAVRIDEDIARAITVRSAIASVSEPSVAQEIAIAPTRYNLGISRGYQSFAQPVRLPDAVRGDLSMPDLAEYRPTGGPRSKPSRFGGRIVLDEGGNTGRAPRTAEALGEQSVDVGGSYRVTGNLDVTAGVRYSQERDPLSPLTNTGEQDSQAVYVGTQFRF